MIRFQHSVAAVWAATLAACGLLLSAAGAATPVSGGAVLRLDAALDQLIDVAAKYETLKSEYFGITEGPVWIKAQPRGYLLFADIGANAIYRWTQEGELQLHAEKSGYTGDMAEVGFLGFGASNGRLNLVNVGSNGTAVDSQGRLIVCAQGDRAIVRIETDGRHTILADRFQGKRLNRPNDLVLRSDGAIYFTDPLVIANRSMEMDSSGVYLLKPDGALTRLLGNEIRPNGLAFSPDEKILYLTDSARKIILQYDVSPDGTIANGRELIDVSADKAPGNLDGMKVDARGNLYSTGPGGIWIISPAGTHLGTILLPETATNMAFGDDDGKTLYVTDRRSLGRIRLKVAGAR